MYKSVYADIEGLMFHDIESLNTTIQSSLEKFNSKQMFNRKESRRELFEEIKKDYLRPLPPVRYQMKERKSVTVMRNSYVTLAKRHYNVPKEYIGKRVDIAFDADTLDIFHGLRLITTHHRNDMPYGYTRKEAHNLPERNDSYEKDLNEVFERAPQIDNIVLLYLREVALEKKYPPLAFRSYRGILSLEKTFGLDRLWRHAHVPRRCVCMDTKMLWAY